jgi:hypothetical protein
VPSRQPTPAPSSDPATVLPGPLEPPPPTPPPGSGSGTIAVPRPTPVRGDPGKPAPKGRGAQATGKPVPAPGPAPVVNPIVIANQVITQAAGQVAVVVKPAAAAAVATAFSFPLTLMLAVLGFLLVQRYVDARDPKLRAAPRTTADALLEFADEEGL